MQLQLAGLSIYILDEFSRLATLLVASDTR